LGAYVREFLLHYDSRSPQLPSAASCDHLKLPPSVRYRLANSESFQHTSTKNDGNDFTLSECSLPQFA
jgi:hypothetical protein